MLDWLLDPFSAGMTQRALVEVVAVGLACGPLGVWILLYRQSYAAESISHGMLPGLVLAVLAGIPLVVGAGAGILVAAGAIALAGRDERLSGDIGVAVAVTGLVGLGALLALSPDVPPRLQELLFGDLLGVTSTDLVVAGVLVAALVALLAVAHRRLALAGFDPAASGSFGTRPGRVDLALLALLGIATVAAVQALGNLLVVALILAPAAAALNVARRLPAALVSSSLLAALAGVLGLLASYHFDVAAGAAVSLSAIALFVLSLPAARRA
jgi:ABC-type Mn2+/Zn2+ transport system permease subunit